MAGAIGFRSLGLTAVSNRSRAVFVFAFDSPTKVSEKRLLWRIGMSERLSAPPAIITSACPNEI